MYCRNYTGTVSHVLCREVYYTVSLFGRVHYQRVHCVHPTKHSTHAVHTYTHAQMTLCKTTQTHVRTLLYHSLGIHYIMFCFTDYQIAHYSTVCSMEYPNTPDMEKRE